MRELWYQCSACGHQVSVTSGTLFQGTRTPLPVWFRAIWWVVSQKNGASALGLKRVLGLGSYETSWTWLHKLRRAMVTPGRERLSGEVEIDDAYLGGPERGLRGRRIQKKAVIIVATEIKGKGIGRIRMQRVSDLGIQNVGRFLEQSVVPGSTIVTDGWHAYARIAGYTHRLISGFDRHDPTTDLLPRAHRVISLLKRWLLGTHQGAVSHAHLDYYLDEFVFRFNRRTSQHRGKLFYRLLQNAVQTPPVPYSRILKRGPQTKTKEPHPVVVT